MYLENIGLRSIGRLLNVPYQTVSQWVKNQGTNIKSYDIKQSEIDVLEIDEIVTFCKKTS